MMPHINRNIKKIKSFIEAFKKVAKEMFGVLSQARERERKREREREKERVSF